MDYGSMVNLMDRQRLFYYSGKTKSLEFRIFQLKKLRDVIVQYEAEVLDALQLDLGKSAFEGYLTEVGTIIGDIDYMLKNLKHFVRSKKIKTPLALLGGCSSIVPEPLGLVLIIGPWNYPLHLTLRPLVGAMAAGNCIIVKPSEMAPRTSMIIKKILSNTFEENYISVIEGGKEEAADLLKQRFDYIFYSGGEVVGKIVMESAAKYLTPVTLELGGKNPCIVDHSADLKSAARRIAWGKFLNAGQTCVAPDYLLVHEKIKDNLISNLVRVIKDFYGVNPKESPHYGRIINELHFDRLIRLIKSGRVLSGGDIDREMKYIAPTIIENVTWEDPIMQEEIFGPLLPVIEYKDLDEAINIVNHRPKSLALYLFTKEKGISNRIIRGTSSGGVCVNDTISHMVSNQLPFGGVGASGMGKYHGRASFDTFSHQKSVLLASSLFDLKDKYPPYKVSLNRIKKLMKLI
jgi:acyl-CoA reductase-like NAD-dependent aldehyde dehydrogenase